MGTQSTRKPVASELAEFVSNLTTEAVPREGIQLAERIFVDTTGVTLAGAISEAAEAAAGTVVPDDSSGVRLLGRDTDASVTNAAFVNGTAAHALDFDDVSSGMQGHPSTTMVPALLAVGEAESASGIDVLAAFVAGFETQCHLSPVINPEHYEAGWHSTSTLGTFGTAAATANLLGLDTPATRNALAIAASLPAGLKRNFGTTTKPIHAGAAARSGVTAALAAANGATGDEQAIDGEKGFFECYAGPGGPDFDELPRLNDGWDIIEQGVSVKKYPCCYFTHTPIANAASIASDRDLEPDDVTSVDVVVSQGADDALHHADPDTGLEGKFSLQYTVASAIVRERVGLSAFDDENVNDPAVQAVRDRVSYEVDPDLKYGSHRSTVTVETTDGETYEATLKEPPGTHDDPLADEELAEKFRMCATQVINEDRADELYERLDDLREERDVADLCRSM